MITELARDTDSWHDLLAPGRLHPAAVRRLPGDGQAARDLAGYAGYGFCASHTRYFWGFRLYLICTAEGMPIIWDWRNPKIGEREVTQALLEHDLITSSAPGRSSSATRASPGGTSRPSSMTSSVPPSVRPDRKDETARFGKLARCRQWIEVVFDTLKGQLTLEEHGGTGLLGRGLCPDVAARLFALPCRRRSGRTGTSAPWSSAPDRLRLWLTINTDSLI